MFNWICPTFLCFLLLTVHPRPDQSIAIATWSCQRGTVMFLHYWSLAATRSLTATHMLDVYGEALPLTMLDLLNGNTLIMSVSWTACDGWMGAARLERPQLTGQVCKWSMALARLRVICAGVLNETGESAPTKKQSKNHPRQPSLPPPSQSCPPTHFYPLFFSPTQLN